MKLLLTISCLLIGLFAQAHGEDKPGPNGGYVRMPGNFHTEVVPDKDGSFHVYLLDLQFQNPSVKDSSLEAKVVSGKATTKLNCEVITGTHYHCKSSKKFKKGSLVLMAKREGSMAGIESKYKLPLKFEKPSLEEIHMEEGGHAGH